MEILIIEEKTIFENFERKKKCVNLKLLPESNFLL